MSTKNATPDSTIPRNKHIRLITLTTFLSVGGLFGNYTQIRLLAYTDVKGHLWHFDFGDSFGMLLST